jgi:uncharacterized membrane protein YhaH (DUF805 family)
MTSMSFTDAVRICLTAKYATFSGRARRSEYWWFSLLYVSVTAVIVGISYALDVPLLNILLLPIIVPMLTVSVRRLHDRGKSGRWMLIALIPIVGPIIYLAGMMIDSAPGANQYGPYPNPTAG